MKSFLTSTFLLLAIALWAEDGDNNNFKNASIIDVNSTVVGSGCFQTDSEDWYKIIVPNNGSIEIKTQSKQLEIDLFLYCSDGSTELDRSDIGNGPIEETHYDKLKAGTYFILVQHRKGKGTYTISTKFKTPMFKDDAEANNSNRTSIVLNSNGVTTGNLGYTNAIYRDREDWYRIDITSKGVFSFSTISDSSLCVVGYLYDDNKNVIAETYTPACSELFRFTRVSVKAGNYYLRLSNYGSTYGSYELKTSFNEGETLSDTAQISMYLPIE